MPENKTVRVSNPRASLGIQRLHNPDLTPTPGRCRIGTEFSGPSVVVTSRKSNHNIPEVHRAR